MHAATVCCSLCPWLIYIFNVIYMQILLTTGLGSSPGIAAAIEFFINSIISGMIYDTIVDFICNRERNDFMKILLLGPGVVYGDMV